ncbi:MAG: sialidase family protein [Actinomycetota bacterium]|nr:glycoside hydrolase [Actinomycetota bacterium]
MSNVRWWARLCGALGAALLIAGVMQVGFAATPASGTISATHQRLTWTGGPMVGSAGAVRRVTCNPSTCDDFALNVDLPLSAFPNHLPVLNLKLETQVPNLMDIIICAPGHCKDVNAADYEVFSASDPGGSVSHAIQAPIKGAWIIRAGCTLCAGATYTMSASVTTIPIPPNHAPNFKNVLLPGPTADQPEGAAEPGIRLGPDGEIWVDGPGGSADFWGSYDGGETWKLNQPAEDAPGDTWITVGPDGTLYADNLVLTKGLANLVYVSKDHGVTWTESTFPANIDSDRQWLTADPKQAGVVYFTYHDIADPLIWVYKTTDYGQTWIPIASISLQEIVNNGKFDTLGGNTSGPIIFDADGTQHMTVTFTDFFEGTIENAHPANEDFHISRIYVLTSTDNGVNWSFSMPVDDYQKGYTHHGHASLTNDKKNNLYLVWSERPVDSWKTDVYMETSTDRGKTWSPRHKVSTNGASNIFATAGAKGDPGRVDVVWLESPAKDFNDHKAQWRVVMAQSTNALSATPTWTRMQVSPHIMHAADVCQAGTLCLASGGNRNLLDYIWMDIDKRGMAHVAYANDLGGLRTVYAKQIGGTGTIANAPAVLGTKTTKPATKPATKLPATGVGTGAFGGVLLSVAFVLWRRARRLPA